jgi:hypothetical protein
VRRIVTEQHDAVRFHGRHPLDELAASVARVGHDDDLAGARPSAPSRDDEPIAGDERRGHRPAAHRDGVEPADGGGCRDRHRGRDRHGAQPAQGKPRTGVR